MVAAESHRFRNARRRYVDGLRRGTFIEFVVVTIAAGVATLGIEYTGARNTVDITLICEVHRALDQMQ